MLKDITLVASIVMSDGNITIPLNLYSSPVDQAIKDLSKVKEMKEQQCYVIIS